MKLDRTYVESLKEYARGIIGGLIFSLPLLYTMEVWWAGFTISNVQLMAGLGVTFLLLIGYNYYAGIREDNEPIEVVIDSVEELGIGLISSAVFLLMLGRVHYGLSAEDAFGRILVEAMAVAIGVSVGTAQLGVQEGEKKDAGVRGAGSRNTFGSRVVLGFCGAILFSLNVAPTEEIVVIAIEASAWNLIGMVLGSVSLGALILYFIDFRGSTRRKNAQGYLHIITGTVVMYAVALTAAAFVLWFFGRFSGVSYETVLAEVVVLGVVSTLGASAGRLLLGV